MKAIDIYLARPEGFASYRLFPDDSWKEAEMPDPEIPALLVVPAATALPFALEVPFADPARIARVLPGMMGDLFARVTPEWRSSWVSRPTGSGARVFGLAFPPDALAPPPLELGFWRLAVPDLFLFPPPPEGGDLALKSPFGEVTATFGPDGFPERFGVAGRGLPARRSSDAKAKRELPGDAVGVFARCERLLADPEGLDLSDWAARRRERLRGTMLAVIGALALGLMLVWHAFLWQSCARLDERRRILTTRMNRAFETAFPGQRAVDPGLQIQRLLGDLEKEAGAVVVPPRLPVGPLLTEILSLPLSGGRIERFQCGVQGWRLEGAIPGYQALETLAQAAARRPSLGAVGQPRGQNIATSGKAGTPGGAEVAFTLEGTWQP